MARRPEPGGGGPRRAGLRYCQFFRGAAIRASLPEPVFVQTTASLRVTFLADPLSARILAALPPGSERFVEHLKRRGRVTTSQAIQLLGVSRPTALGSTGSRRWVSSRPFEPPRTTRAGTGGRASRARCHSKGFRVAPSGLCTPPCHGLDVRPLPNVVNSPPRQCPNGP